MRARRLLLSVLLFSLPCALDAAPTAPRPVVVVLQEQAPAAALNRALLADGVPRAERHRAVIEALREAADGQAPLLAWLDARRAAGELLRYRGHWIANLVVLEAASTTVEAVARRADVAAVTPLPAPTVEAPRPTGAGDRAIGVPPGIRAIGADRVWNELGFTGAGALVGILDTGVDVTHPALAGSWRGNGAPAGECWLDLLDGTSGQPVDLAGGHGTHVLGTVVGLAPGDSIGVAPGAEWIACNAIGQGVSPEFNADIFAALEWFADPDGDAGTLDDVPDVLVNAWGVNENFGYADCDALWWAAIDNCEAAGVVLLFTAGGDGPAPGTVRSPADRATTALNSFAVGAVDASIPESWPYPLASFSSRGPSGCDVAPGLEIKPELVAPGVNVVSSVPGGSYAIWSGSAMAVAHAAGVVALMRGANPELDVDSLKELLLATARDEGDPGEDNGYGWGVVDAFAAVQGALGSATAAPASPDAPPARLRLARPNPFRPARGAAVLAFTLPSPAAARLDVVDVSGRHLRTLLAGELPAGEHVARWDGRDDAGRALGAGVYLVRLDAGGTREARSLVLLR
ncbi:S8 family serine peptidase [bacterium]|nr:S8 family serine peptidase [bacterium]